MYEITSTGQDSHGADVVIITCRACGYFEEHFARRGLDKNRGTVSIIGYTSAQGRKWQDSKTVHFN